MDQPGGPFEHHLAASLREAAFDVLHGVCPEELPNLDLDLVVRLGNQVGVAEITVKTSGRKRKIEQLSTATQRERLRTYTSRFLILNHNLDANNEKLDCDSNIAVIVLSNSGDRGISPGDRARLVGELQKSLGAEP